jgi:hypothetical protein
MVLGNGQMMISCAHTIMLSWASGNAQTFGIFSVYKTQNMNLEQIKCMYFECFFFFFKKSSGFDV